MEIDLEKLTEEELKSKIFYTKRGDSLIFEKRGTHNVNYPYTFKNLTTNTSPFTTTTKGKYSNIPGLDDIIFYE